VAEKIGRFGRPKTVIFTDDLPKTRSGKIMRRLLRDVAENRPLGDTTTLADATVVEEIRHHVQAEKSARGEVPRELSEQEKAEIAAYGHAE